MIKNNKNNSNKKGNINSKNDSARNESAQNDENDNIAVEKFDREFFSTLPDILKNITLPFKTEDERLVVLLSSITVLSSVLPNLYGEYDKKRLHANLYLYILGKASSGKGNANWSKLLLKPLQEKLNNVNTLVEEIGKYGLDINTIAELKKASSNKRLIIPANNSASGFMTLLSRNGGDALLFETEGDTLANTLRTDYGNYSDVLRKGFHHETISQFRKGTNELIEFDFPKISVALTSTANQLYSLIPDTENGLFSRFMFYQTESTEGFKNVFEDLDGTDFNKLFIEEGNNVLYLYEQLKETNGVCFTFSDKQKAEFQEFFSFAKSALINFISADLDASINRLGCIFFRIAMIMSCMRHSEENAIGNSIVCSDVDFDNTQKIVSLLINTVAKVISEYPNKEVAKLSQDKRLIYEELSDEFTTNEALKLSKKHKMCTRTLYKFLSTDCFIKLKHASYKKAA